MSRVKVGIIGCGAIGEGVALFLNQQLRKKARIWALADREIKKAISLKEKLRPHPKIYDNDTLIKEVNLVIEAASQECAKEVLKKAIALKKDVIILSVGALIAHPSLLKKARRKGITVYVPSGAICGVDGLGALSAANIERITLITSKPPRSLIGAEYLKKKKFNLAKIKKEKTVFEGSVLEAIKYFPKNINVAATLLLASSFCATGGFRSSLASCGQKIRVCIKANPQLKRNIHRIEIEAKEARVAISVENVPSKSNPKTSALTILSTQYLLQKIFSPFKIGS